MAISETTTLWVKLWKCWSDLADSKIRTRAQQLVAEMGDRLATIDTG